MQQPRPPLLIGASRRRLLELAAREAGVAERIGWIRDAAGPRFEQLELNLNLMAVGQQVPRCSESLGISYIAVGDELMEALAPVVERLAGN